MNCNTTHYRANSSSVPGDPTALSYARKTIEGVEIKAGELLPFSTGLTSEAIRQEEIVVEAKARQDRDVSLLAARRKAPAVGDAISAEQVRRTPDKDAAEVLKRVTGLSVSDGKYVFVRGLGERYSSTEVDGVRVASPEQNKRVVPLDLLPAGLLDHIVVQKTYTADRPGEFGGGDVQVHTKDFPGSRTWSFTTSQGYEPGVTFHDRLTYSSTRADLFGFGADARAVPGAVDDVAGTRPLALSSNPSQGFSRSTLAAVARSFGNVWSPQSERAVPNASYSATYGDEFRVFGRPLGLVQSWNLSRNFDQREGPQRFFAGGSDTLYDYQVRQSTESVRLGGISALSYRLSPRHALHVRGLYSNSADDEVRVYEGQDHNRVEPTTGTWLVHRNTRLRYVERSIASGSIEGQHDLTHLLGTSLGWKLTRSEARRREPDRRETTYDRGYYMDGAGQLVGYWGLGSVGRREYGDLRDRGWGATVTGTVPYALGSWGKGRIAMGIDRQDKTRTNHLRRFNFYTSDGADPTMPPESLFSARAFDGSGTSGYVEEATLNQDNYRATHRVSAAYVSTDVPFGARVRATLGLRAERGEQSVRSFDLFDPSRITAQGGFENTDWLPSGNVTVGLTSEINLRLAASRTLSRPDLNELSPSPALEYVGGFLQSGNPDLHRSTIDNYDLRLETFPSLSEVLAAGFFYKSLHEPIEQTLVGGAPPVLVPRNSDRGRNLGIEIESRADLGRYLPRIRGTYVNGNASFISSEVHLKTQVSELGTTTHPLQGQATYLVNVGVGYTDPHGRMEGNVLWSAVGTRLHSLAHHPLPDVYEQPSQSLDATVLVNAFWSSRVKLSAKNLLDPRIRELQGTREVSSYRAGRSYSIAITLGGS